MKKYLKVISSVLALVGVVFMFMTQVVVKFSSTITESLNVSALVDGKYNFGTKFTGAYSGLAGYILLGVAAIILLLVAFSSIKNHDMLSIVLTGLAVIMLIVGIILIFTIRRNFMEANGLLSEQVYVGWGAITGGVFGSLSILSGLLSMVFDLSGN